jgi:hypothetical protein
LFSTLDAVQARQDVLSRQLGSAVMRAGVRLDLRNELVFVVGAEHLAAVLAQQAEFQCRLILRRHGG